MQNASEVEGKEDLKKGKDKEMKASSFYVWKAIPPTENFVALGMIGTTSAEEPSRQCMRCVPKSWLALSSTKPQKMWDDSGTGGRAGSLWAMTSMQLLTVTSGHLVPEGDFYELKSNDFMAATEIQGQGSRGKRKSSS